MKYPLNNYNLIVTDFIECKESLDKIIFQKPSQALLPIYNQYLNKLQSLLTLQANVNTIVDFLNTNPFPVEVQDYSLEQYVNLFIPSISLGRRNGNSLGIAKYILSNTEDKILLVTKSSENYVVNKDLNKVIQGTNTIITSGFSKTFPVLRGRIFDKIILEDMSVEEVYNFIYTNIPPNLISKIIRVGSNI